MRSKPVTIACRTTKEKKKAFYEKAGQLRKKPQEVLESLVNQFLEGAKS